MKLANLTGHLKGQGRLIRSADAIRIRVSVIMPLWTIPMGGMG